MRRINITCPACGSKAYLRPASVVYGDKAPDPDAKYYVCGRYPACDCYVAAHRKTMLPMGTLADKALRKKRHDAHVALDSLWKNGVMSRKEAYRLLQLSMGLPAEDAHIILPGGQQAAFVVEIDVGEMVFDLFHHLLIAYFPCVLVLYEILLHLLQCNAICVCGASG